MNNKKITSMILTTISLALLAVMITPEDVFANHTPWYGGPVLTNGDAEFYFHYSTLNILSVDGDRTSNYSKVKGEVEDAMVTYNNLGNDIDLTTTGSYGAGDYIVYGADLGVFGPSGQASYPNGSDYVRFNDWRDFGTSGGCNLWYAYNLEYLTNHEFGHTTGLAHQSSSENSVMVSSCDASKWSTVQSHDESVLDTQYP